MPGRIWGSACASASSASAIAARIAASSLTSLTARSPTTSPFVGAHSQSGTASHHSWTLS